MAFTDSKIKSIRAGKERKVVWEDGQTCLGLRVSPQGRKSFIFMYRFEGRPRMMTLGQYPVLTLADARVMLAKGKAQLEEGGDPGSAKLTAKAERKGAPTVASLSEEYLEKWAKPRKRSWKEDKRVLDRDVIPKWGKKKAKEIKRRDIVLLLDKIVERGAPVMANRTLGILRKMFSFAVGRDILESSPCFSIQAPGKETQRDRVLSEDELRIFWHGLEDANMFQGTRTALRFQLVTAQRKGEIVGAEWSEIDFENGWWTIPAHKSKNGLPHRVPLTQLAFGLLEEAKAISPESPWVFPSPRHGKPVTPRALSRAISNNRDKFKMPQFSCHDLRRSAASQMAGAGVLRLTISKILNHVEGGVTAIYDRHSYDMEKRQALETWERKLESILTGKKGKVISIQK